MDRESVSASNKPSEAMVVVAQHVAEFIAELTEADNDDVRLAAYDLQKYWRRKVAKDLGVVMLSSS